MQLARLHIIALGLLAPAGEASEPTLGGAPVPPADNKLTIGQRIAAAVQDKAGLLNQIGELKTQLQGKTSLSETLQTDLTAALARATKAEADLKQIETSLAVAEREAVTLRGAEQNLDTRANNKAIELVASVGFPAVKLPAAQSLETAPKLTTRAEKEAHLEARLKTVTSLKERLQLIAASGLN